MMPQNGVIALVATQQCLQTVSLVSSAPSLTFQQVVSVFVTRLSAPERAGRGRASKPLRRFLPPSEPHFPVPPCVFHRIRDTLSGVRTPVEISEIKRTPTVYCGLWVVITPGAARPRPRSIPVPRCSAHRLALYIRVPRSWIRSKSTGRRRLQHWRSRPMAIGHAAYGHRPCSMCDCSASHTHTFLCNMRYCSASQSVRGICM